MSTVLLVGPVDSSHALVSKTGVTDAETFVNRADRKPTDTLAKGAVSVQPTHSDAVLADIAKALAPGSKFVLQPLVGTIPADVVAKTSETFQRVAPLISSAAQVSTKLLLAGFVDTQVGTETDITDAQKEVLKTFGITADDFSALAAHVKIVEIVTSTPNYDASATEGLTIKKKEGASAWTLDGDDNDVIDENALLNEDELRAKPEDTEDCRTNTRIACKNCVCGRAEELEKEKVTIELDGMDPEEKASACGNCTRGDAFRCATCPSLGLPVGQRKVGEKIELVL